MTVSVLPRRPLAAGVSAVLTVLLVLAMGGRPAAADTPLSTPGYAGCRHRHDHQRRLVLDTRRGPGRGLHGRGDPHPRLRCAAPAHHDDTLVPARGAGPGTRSTSTGHGPTRCPDRDTR